MASTVKSGPSSWKSGGSSPVALAVTFCMKLETPRATVMPTRLDTRVKRSLLRKILEKRMRNMHRIPMRARGATGRKTRVMREVT